MDARKRWLIIISLLLATIAEASSLLYPQVFVPRLIKHFGYEQKQVGYYVGILNSARYAGNIFGAVFWSSLSDTKGRRVVILINLAFSVPCNLLFGLAPNFTAALIARLLIGATSAVIPLCKTVVYEISNKDNQVTAMSVVNFGFVFGVILAANMGAFLSDPYRQFGDSFPEMALVRRYPFALPSLLYSGYCCLVLVLCYFFLEETKQPEGAIVALNLTVKNNLEDQEGVRAKSPDADSIAGNGGARDSPLQWQQRERPQQHRDPLLFSSVDRLDKRWGAAPGAPRTGVSGGRCRSHQQLAYRHGHHHTHAASAAAPAVGDLTFGAAAALASTSVAELRQKDALELEDRQPAVVRVVSATPPKVGACAAFLDLVRRLATVGRRLFTEFPLFRVVLLVYTVTCSATVMFDECVSVFALDSAAGLGLQSMHLGLVNNLALVALMPFIAMLPPLSRRFGPMRVHLFGLLLGVLAVTSFPLSVLFGCRSSSTVPCVLGIGAILTVKNVCLFWCFTTASVLLNNSVSASTAGTANGVGIVFSNVSRIIGISVGTSLLQFTMNRELAYPLDYNLVFVTVGALLCVCGGVQTLLPLHIEDQVHK